MTQFTLSRLAAPGAVFGGALFAVAGALQTTGLDWAEDAVQTPLQHLTMALFAAALVAVLPAVRLLARHAGGRTHLGWIGIAVGQAAVAAAATVSNLRGVDASWFPAVAIPANALWVLGTFTLAVGLYRTKRIPRLLAVGLVVAYLGAIPLAIQGGGLLTGCYWLAVGYLIGLDSLERRTTLNPSTV